MSDKDNPPDIVAMLDQADTELENIARPLASYYETLIDAGLPEKLAHDLVIDLQSRFWRPLSE